ncbi:hypothetical protein GpartN1_g4133.t1 [Galdieria partita]|uniref:Uncharacterized protein n=1 Tax=Galdieria partita TaxID=83374 RepID=A0A9C7PZF8_9RHOD|nr:hypothetical protein GpartN1_g4133.t1 [Galdieria partita]
MNFSLVFLLFFCYMIGCIILLCLSILPICFPYDIWPLLWIKTSLQILEYILCNILNMKLVLSNVSEVVNSTEPSYLAKPWIQCYESKVKCTRRGERECCSLTVRTYDQPGRWMSKTSMDLLVQELRQIAQDSLDEIPLYGVFSGNRESLKNRIISIAYDKNEPVGFTAMCYLPPIDSSVVDKYENLLQAKNSSWNQYILHLIFRNVLHLYHGPILHLGLTMIKRHHRGRGIQSSIFLKCLILPVLNQRKLFFPITNIAASPAGIGAVSDYFFMSYPTYHTKNRRFLFHLATTLHVLASSRHEFGCSTLAKFEESTFVVRGSNDPTGGGAFAFIKEDGKPVSQYKNPLCNQYCASLLRLEAGDELFQVAIFCPLFSIFQFLFSNLSYNHFSRKHVSLMMEKRKALLIKPNMHWYILGCLFLVVYFAWSRSILVGNFLRHRETECLFAVA